MVDQTCFRINTLLNELSQGRAAIARVVGCEQSPSDQTALGPRFLDSSPDPNAPEISLEIAIRNAVYEAWNKAAYAYQQHLFDSLSKPSHTLMGTSEPFIHSAVRRFAEAMYELRDARKYLKQRLSEEEDHRELFGPDAKVWSEDSEGPATFEFERKEVGKARASANQVLVELFSLFRELRLIGDDTSA